MSEVVFTDLDSTLADTRQRQWIIDEYPDRSQVNWDRYSLACEDDVPFPGPVALVNMLYTSGRRVVIVTNRSVVALQPTLRWLYQHKVLFTNLIMREPEADQEPTEEFKVRRIRQWLRSNNVTAPSLILEDWPPAAERLAAEGWPVLLFNPYPAKEPGEASPWAKDFDTAMQEPR